MNCWVQIQVCHHFWKSPTPANQLLNRGPRPAPLACGGSMQNYLDEKRFCRRHWFFQCAALIRAAGVPTPYLGEEPPKS